MTINESDPLEVLRAIMEDWPRDYRMDDPLTEIEESLSDQFEKLSAPVALVAASIQLGEPCVSCDHTGWGICPDL